MTTFSEKLFANKRKEPRKPYSGLISFVYKKHLYPGSLINYSPSGLFIKAHSIFLKGEKITIRYNAGSVNNQVTIRVFDLAGRLVTTLLDERVELSQNTLEWDGRDHLFDYVGLGTYICHLEVMEPVSGKKRNKMAPIVVGTMLKK